MLNYSVETRGSSLSEPCILSCLFFPLGFERRLLGKECGFVLVIRLRGYLDNGLLTRRCLWFFPKSFIPIVINLCCITVKIKTP